MASKAYNETLKPAEAATATFTDVTGRYETACLQAASQRDYTRSYPDYVWNKLKHYKRTICNYTRKDWVANPAEEIPSSKEGIIIESDKASYKIGESVVYTVTNSSEKPFEIGYAFTLEKKFGGKWKDVRSNLQVPLSMEIINPSEKFKNSIFLNQGYFEEPLTTGEYKATHGVFPKDNARSSKVEVAVYFTITE